MPAKLKAKTAAARDGRTGQQTTKKASVLVRSIKKRRRKGPLTALIGAGAGSFQTTEEADKYLRQLRDEWDK